MVVFFLLLVVIVQAGFFLVARSAVSAAVDGAARRVAASPDRGDEGEARLIGEVGDLLPGATITGISVTVDDRRVEVDLRVRWVPPGPDLMPVTLHAHSSRVIAIPP